MIIARPTTGTLVSFTLFLIISYILSGVSSYILFHDHEPAWFNYLILFLLVPIASYSTWKVLFRYKIVRIGNRQIEVRHPQFRSFRKYALEEVDAWMESSVQTGKTSVYKELEVRFKDGRKIQMGHNEFTGYDAMVRYLTQKIPGLKIN